MWVCKLIVKIVELVQCAVISFSPDRWYSLPIHVFTRVEIIIQTKVVVQKRPLQTILFVCSTHQYLLPVSLVWSMKSVRHNVHKHKTMYALLSNCHPFPSYNNPRISQNPSAIKWKQPFKRPLLHLVLFDLLFNFLFSCVCFIYFLKWRR